MPCGSFFQVNAAGAAALADEVAALIAARKPARFIDLYAGPLIISNGCQSDWVTENYSASQQPCAVE